jgi:hypothetical protein
MLLGPWGCRSGLSPCCVLVGLRSALIFRSTVVSSTDFRLDGYFRGASSLTFVYEVEFGIGVNTPSQVKCFDMSI